MLLLSVDGRRVGLVGDSNPPLSNSPRSGVAFVGELVYPSDELEPDMDSRKCRGPLALGALPLPLTLDGVLGPVGAGLLARLLCGEPTEPSDGLGDGNWPSDSRLRCRDEEEVGIVGPRAGVDWAAGNKSIEDDDQRCSLAQLGMYWLRDAACSDVLMSSGSS